MKIGRYTLKLHFNFFCYYFLSYNSKIISLHCPLSALYKCMYMFNVSLLHISFSNNNSARKKIRCTQTCLDHKSTCSYFIIFMRNSVNLRCFDYHMYSGAFKLSISTCTCLLLLIQGFNASFNCGWLTHNTLRTEHYLYMYTLLYLQWMCFFCIFKTLEMTNLFRVAN